MSIPITMFGEAPIALQIAISRLLSFKLENIITIRHLENMNKFILATGTMVGYAYAMEFFMAWYSGNQYEAFAFINPNRFDDDSQLGYLAAVGVSSMFLVSLNRKLKEAILAFRIERSLSKERILELYLNQIYLGQGTYGIASASLEYFDKSVDELKYVEAALLAALPKAPSRYNPYKNKKLAKFV